jgi:hypothetical protein
VEDKSSTHEEAMKDHKARKQADNFPGGDVELAILLCKKQ